MLKKLKVILKFRGILEQNTSSSIRCMYGKKNFIVVFITTCFDGHVDSVKSSN